MLWQTKENVSFKGWEKYKNFGVIKIISAQGDDCHELVKPGAEERKFNLLKPILSQCISLQTENNWSVHSAAT